MTKLISVLIILVCIIGGIELWNFWERIANDKEESKRDAQSIGMRPDELPGMPGQLEGSLQIAQNRGAVGLKEWLNAYGKSIQDPRKAWIELDYVVAVARDNPGEAHRIFADVKSRTPTNSPIIKRIRSLEKTYE